MMILANIFRVNVTVIKNYLFPSRMSGMFQLSSLEKHICHFISIFKIDPLYDPTIFKYLR